ncbi:hypothetical protein ACFWP5_10770 [Streptomyces sp. NPDC058469]|uniref:hypothetical protein n=1 Tax=Streptomyces sp. NPDC058469 TaxID=3346514 RepID=UPI0036546A7A
METVILLQVTDEAQSLAWDGDDLVDVVGGRRWGPDRVERHVSVDHGFSFDRSVSSPSGRFTVVYDERGTEALLLEGDRPVRELERDNDHAEDFDYPVALGVLWDGREVLVHCPDEYDVLEIEDAETGERLTGGDRTRNDVFHSRPAVSPGGTHLLSAGWVWHPYGIVEVFDLDRALTDPAVLDGRGVLSLYPGNSSEVISACWLDGDRVAVATGEEFVDEEETAEAADLGRRQLGVWSLSEKRWVHRNRVDFHIGTLIPRGDTVVSLYGHPRLIDVTTGASMMEWPTVEVPSREGSYGITHIPTPVAALHPDGNRLAVAQPDSIAIIALPEKAF